MSALETAYNSAVAAASLASEKRRFPCRHTIRPRRGFATTAQRVHLGQMPKCQDRLLMDCRHGLARSRERDRPPAAESLRASAPHHHPDGRHRDCLTTAQSRHCDGRPHRQSYARPQRVALRRAVHPPLCQQFRRRPGVTRRPAAFRLRALRRILRPVPGGPRPPRGAPMFKAPCSVAAR